MTWIETFLAEVNSVDLSSPCPTQKRISKEETIIGELNEYLQKLYRLRELHKDSAEIFRDQIEDLGYVHETEHGLGTDTASSCDEYVTKVGDAFGHFKARFDLYATIDHLLSKEIETVFPLQSAQFEVLGIRDGKTLVGREGDSRDDNDSLTAFYVQIQISLNLHKVLSNY